MAREEERVASRKFEMEVQDVHSGFSCMEVKSHEEEASDNERTWVSLVREVQSSRGKETK